MGSGDLEEACALLEATGDYRILRRIQRKDRIHDDDGREKKIGVLLDVETTGLDLAKDESIELGMVQFEFTPDGRIFRVLDVFSAFNQPSIPIPESVVKLTGITDDLVHGKTISPVDVAAFVEPAVVVIAHNAGFDRRFAERIWPGFAEKAWACSMTQVDWRSEGFEGSKLGYLLAGCGLFHDAHRAVDDCWALLEILAQPLPKSMEPALKQILDTARKTTFRVWAENSPFDLKDILKARGYRWNDGSNGRSKAWWIDVLEENLKGEMEYLYKDIYRRRVDLPTQRISAFERFSDRG